MKGKWIAVIVVGVIVLAALVGFGGYRAGVSAGVAQGLTTRDAFLAARGIGNGQGGGAFAGQGGARGQGNGQGFNPNNFAAGQVKQINGDTIQLSTAQSTVTVKLNPQTQIQKMGPGAVSDIQTGERITVQGTRAADGSFTAQSIQIGGRFAGGGQNAQPGQGTGANTTASNSSN